jgi:uncharacterized protein YhaN
MANPRLVSIELTYGCHNGRFAFPERSGPVVILGPNGAGKTTLMEALVLTLYGIDLRREPHRLLARVPWQTELCMATVVIADERGENLSVDRNFRTQEVVVRRVADGVELFRGDGSPAATNVEASKYRRWLASRVGLEEREQYENTACINQGELIRTRLGQHLLLVAAGGHRDVATAKTDIEEAYYDLTQEPLVEGERRRLRGRKLEDEEHEVAALERRLAEVREAQGRAKPILEEREAALAELARCRAELARLEQAMPALEARRAVRMARERLVDQLSRLEGMQRDLETALIRIDSAQEARTLLGDETSYPEDFRERLAALEELWPRQAQLRREVEAREGTLAGITVPPLAAAMASSFAVALSGIAVILTGRTAGGMVLLLVGLLGAVGFGLWRRTVGAQWHAAMEDVETAARALNEVDDRILAKLRGLPDALTLGPETAADRRLRYETEQKARLVFEEARRRLADVLTRARRELDAAGPELASIKAGPTVATAGQVSASEGPGQPVSGGPGAGNAQSVPAPGKPTPTGLGEKAARQTLQHIGDALNRDRTLLAAKDLELRRALDGPSQLPADVPAEADAAEAAMSERRTRIRDLELRLSALAKELDERGRASESPVALEAALQDARARWAELSAKVDVCRRAYGLVRDAYDEFHTRDQERLLNCISNQLINMTGGVLGPLEAPDTLESVRVLAGGRALALESPPLSYGEFHAVLLSVRLGAADFLAKTGVRPPFLVDEPFTHLDEERAKSVWRLLTSIARDRQVIVATQDRLILDALGIEPDVVLTRNRTSRPISSLASTTGLD